MNISKELKTAINAAKKAGKHALSYRNRKIDIFYKPDGTPVTKADEECEEVIKKVISKQFPDAKFIGEESGGNYNDSEFWTIDPIDGTKAFTRNIPHWAVLISLYKNNDVELGVSYIPGMEELLFAQKGKGTYLNNKQVHVSSHPTLSKAFMTFPTSSRRTPSQKIHNIVKSAMWARSLGNAPSFHLLAQGKTDLHIEIEHDIWDLSAFKVIIEEAGGKFTGHDGSNWNLKVGSIVASNGLVHDEIINMLNEK